MLGAKVVNCWEPLRAVKDWEISSEADGKPSERSTTRLSSLKEKYESGMTFAEIAAETGINKRTLARWFKDAGIKARKVGQRGNQARLNDVAWLTDQYVTKQMSCAQIGRELGCTEETANRALKRAGIPVRRFNTGRKFPEVGARHSVWLKGRFTGSKNPNWRGNAVKRYKRERSSYEAKKWSLDVRARDGHKCVECGATERLHAHHIKEWRRNKAARYELSNGVTLCVVCHQRKHRNQFAAFLLVPKGKKSTSATRPL
jgi:5-methylcytosine-specific restriction endonuclease McrA/transposase-like protein